MRTLAMTMVMVMCFWLTGCAENQSETRTTLGTLRDIAQSGNVQGKVRVRLSGMAEGGLKNGFYLGTEGSSIEADLEYKFSEPAATQPVK